MRVSFVELCRRTEEDVSPYY